MNKILALLFFILFASPLAGQGEKGGNGQSLLWLDAKSKLTIHVDTNVNGFPCEFISSKKSDAISIDYEAIDRNYVSIENAKMAFPLAKFDCGQTLKNREFREFLNEADYPTIAINLNGLEIYDRTSDGAIGKFIATVEVAAQERQEDIQIIDITSDDFSTVYTGRVTINVRAYGLEPPVKFLGMVKVRETVEIEFLFRFIGDAN